MFFNLLLIVILYFIFNSYFFKVVVIFFFYWVAKGIFLFVSVPLAPRRVFRVFSGNQTSLKTISLPAGISVIHSSCCLCPKTIQKYKCSCPLAWQCFIRGPWRCRPLTQCLHRFPGVLELLQTWLGLKAMVSQLHRQRWQSLDSWGVQGSGLWTSSAKLWSTLGNQMEHPPESHNHGIDYVEKDF